MIDLPIMRNHQSPPPSPPPDSIFKRDALASARGDERGACGLPRVAPQGGMMGGFDTRELIQAAAASLAEPSPATPARPRRAVPIAEGVAEVTLRPSCSPVLLAGVVRAVEL